MIRIFRKTTPKTMAEKVEIPRQGGTLEHTMPAWPVIPDKSDDMLYERRLSDAELSRLMEIALMRALVAERKATLRNDQLKLEAAHRAKQQMWRGNQTPAQLQAAIDRYAATESGSDPDWKNAVAANRWHMDQACTYALVLQTRKAQNG